MLSLNSKSCSLPRHASFEPLASPCADVPLSEPGSAFFSSHKCWRLPCDTACAAGRNRKGACGSCDSIHRVVLQRTVSEALNHRLHLLAMDAAASPEAGVARSNLGGFQSRADLFVAHEDVEADRMDSTARALHGIVSAAMEELMALRVPSDGGPRHEPQPHGSPHAAYAWLNVNRPSDSNLMHIHDPAKYSAVYFVSAGGASAASRAAYATGGRSGVADERPLAGRLVFRGGRSSAVATHTYLAALPEPGALWIFPGAVPHCVMPYGGGDAAAVTAGRAGATSSGRGARVSVAINFVDDRDDVPAPT